MAEDPGTDTRVVPISGRSIVVRHLKDAQLALMAREAKQVQRNDVDDSRRLDAGARLFDILESAVVQDGDRDFVLDEITAGRVELKDLLEFITAFSEEERPKVRRGRPRTIPR